MNEARTLVTATTKVGIHEITEMFASPNKFLVTEIEYLNGEKSKMVTAAPIGIGIFNVENGINVCLRRQPNIQSFSSVLVEKDGEEVESTIFFGKVVLNENNRLPKLDDIEQYSTAIGVTKSIFKNEDN